ncbi:IPT/TIG domain-containing protein [Mucilaginibacter sp. FT3.2]|uniref:IPT/TIG domain-containing protein n=1 Tax=Mucilaginibacter sp. FT3.2 TaxID=2723090 RepID=UPI0016170299|nr:IPT/TIG domain-containing protein [Mucilaginibacter sp. FT3.2]MBB6233764.1 hypothetical protein [Mucilaginibacter sp. FT3.2]
MKKLTFAVYSLLILFGLSQFGCKKEKQNIPAEIKTIQVTALSSTKAIIKGNIIAIGSNNLSDYGFIYSSSLTDINNNNGAKISLGSGATQGEFSKEADGLLLTAPDNSVPTLYVKAYITNDKGTVYGETLSTFMTASASDNISSKSGSAGDQIVFQGKFQPNGTEVTFGINKVKGKIISTIDNEILVEIPSGILAEHKTQIPIQITSGGLVVTNITDFTILARITDYSPKTGPSETPIIFSGDNLPAKNYTLNDITVLFDGAAGFAYFNTVDFRAAISSLVKVTETQVSIVINKKTIILPGKFKITPPIITSVTPSSGIPGTHIIVTGTDLPANYNFSTAAFPTVTIGDKLISAPVPTTNGKSIVFDIPTSLVPGSYDFKISVGPYVITAPQKITVLAPGVSSFKPTSGWFGSYISIFGTFLPGQTYTVSIGSVNVNVDCTEDGKITFPTPKGVNKGSVVLAVTINNIKVIVANNFQIVGPSIFAFSPTSGPRGTSVVITGEGFYGQSTGYDNIVFVGPLQAAIFSIDPRQLYIEIPQGAAPGPQKITVTANGETAVSTIDFTVTP